MTNKPTLIYALADPRTNEVRYVGKTINLRVRMQVRLREAMRAPKTHEHYWVRSLLQVGVEPLVVILEEVPADGDWAARERAHIAALRADGARLCNLTDGGDGMPGYRWTAEQRARLRVALNKDRKPRTAEHIEKIAAANRGKPHTAEHKAKISASLLRAGHKLPPERRDDLGAWARGRPRTAEHVAKIQATRRANAKPVSAETRAKISAAGMGRRWTPEQTARRVATRKANAAARHAAATQPPPAP